MFTTEPSEEVKNIVDEYKGLITRASLLCKEYIKLKGCDYGYSVFDVTIDADRIYFKYRHYDGVMFWGPPVSIPLDYLSDENWQERARLELEKDKADGLRYSQLKTIYEERYLVPEFVVTKYIEDVETGNGKAERLEWLRLKDKFYKIPSGNMLIAQGGQVHYKWNQK